MKLPRCNFLRLAADAIATRLMLVLLALTFTGAASAQSLTPEERQALSPTGKLRTALYLGGPTNVIKDPNSGEMKGVGYDLGKELARRMGVPYEPVIYQTPKLLVEDVNSGKWDISFVARDFGSRKDFEFHWGVSQP